MSHQQTSRPVLDHIVILVPASFLTAPPSWLAESFHFSPGGRHANGVTENVLVLLPDGSYIEFIAFVAGTTPEERRGHKWGRYEDGTIVDWALTVDAPGGPDMDRDYAFVDGITTHLRQSGAGIVYGDRIPGGRLRPDGVKLEWATVPARSAAGEGDAPDHGQVPFWCLDGSPRDLRVPYQSVNDETHPSGVVGVAEISITPSAGVGSSSDVRQVYAEVLQGPREGPWKLAALESDESHRDVIVSVSTTAPPGLISVSLFTKRPDLAGKVLGGAGGAFQFKFVGI